MPFAHSSYQNMICRITKQRHRWPAQKIGLCSSGYVFFLGIGVNHTRARSIPPQAWAWWRRLTTTVTRRHPKQDHSAWIHILREALANGESATLRKS